MNQPVDLGPWSIAQLLVLHGQVGEELRRRGVIRSANNPTGDLAEHLFCTAFGWSMAGRSNPAIDATGPDGRRYQIKGRRHNPMNKSRQLGALRGLPEATFDHLAAVLFAPDYTVLRAAIIPHGIVAERARFVARTNSWKFMLTDGVWNLPGVVEATEPLRAVSL